MAKELTHRGEELKVLGWSQEDVLRYTELWDYRQRWGAINLEREDRQFLRKAESALPVITKAKASVKKPLTEKSYYRWLRFYLDEMNSFEGKQALANGERGLWPIVLEEELRALNYYQPVLGLPDTIKAKLINNIREDLIGSALKMFVQEGQIIKFNFGDVLSSGKAIEGNSSWRSLREGDQSDSDLYPLIQEKFIPEFRQNVRTKLLPFIRENFPSLVETEKPEPPDDWDA